MLAGKASINCHIDETQLVDLKKVHYTLRSCLQLGGGEYSPRPKLGRDHS